MDDDAVQTRARSVAILITAALGLIAVIAVAGLPWNDPNFEVSVPVRLVMGLAGAGILTIAALAPMPRVLRIWVTVLGVAVILYPTTLTLAAAGLGGPVVAAMAAVGHGPPLVLVQALPVLAAALATGRSRRLWLVLIVAFPVVGNAIGALGGPLAGALGALGSLLWFSSFALAPIAAWTTVPGTSGLVRRRAVVAGVGSVLPVAIIAFCLALGGATAAQGMPDDLSINALMVGFSLATSGAAVLAAAAVGPETSRLLGTRTVRVLLHVLVAVATVLVAACVALVALAGGLGAMPTAVLGIAVAVAIGLPAARLVGWASRAIDPAAELTRQLTSLGEPADGEHRLALQQALRQVLDDPGLLLLVRATDGTWVDAAGQTEPAPPEHAAPLAGPAEAPVAVVVLESPRAQARLAGLGDITAAARPAILEASVLRERTRAQEAAHGERIRLSRDLHDGLQGRLLGIALNLQLSGQQVADPATRLLIEDTVDSLRDSVEEVRSLTADGLPATLADHGLRPALSGLVGRLGIPVALDVSVGRYPADVERTVYFVVSEAISNAVKHAGADQVRVTVDAVGSQVEVVVADDGAGGADPRLGSGLRGLAERVAASGGLLVVRENDPHGTVVEASVPCWS